MGVILKVILIAAIAAQYDPKITPNITPKMTPSCISLFVFINISCVSGQYFINVGGLLTRGGDYMCMSRYIYIYIYIHTHMYTHAITYAFCKTRYLMYTCICTSAAALCRPHTTGVVYPAEALKELTSPHVRGWRREKRSGSVFVQLEFSETCY